MSLKFFADLRETFVELTEKGEDLSKITIRTLNRKDQMTLGLKEAVNLLNADQERDLSQSALIIRTDICDTYWREKWFPSMALITTEGFQRIFDIENPSGFSPFKSDSSFGISERVLNDGSVLKEIKIEELSFIHEKLQLSEIKNIIISFLHSSKNNTNEKAAEKYFSELGYKVQLACDFKGDEKQRLLSAARFLSDELVLANMLEEIKPLGFKTLEVETRRAPGVYVLEDQICFADSTGVIKKSALTPYSPIFVDHTGLPQIRYQNISSEPGPVCFGKGVELTVFDLLALKNGFQFTDIKRLKIDQARTKKYFQLFAQQMRTNWEALSDDFLKLFKQLLLLEVPDEMDIKKVSVTGWLAPFIFDGVSKQTLAQKEIGALASE